MPFFKNLIENITIYQQLEFLFRIVVASLCGAFIGLERTRRFKEAGIRTHILVACASALMMVVSKYGFADLVSEGGFLAGTDGADASRIAAQVICGISFLGAGVIFKHGSSVKGLTTAAGIWATAGIGLAIGGGMYLEGIFVTIFIMFAQFIMHKLALGGKDLVEAITVSVRVYDGEKFKSEFENMLLGKKSSATYVSVKKNEDGTKTYKISLLLSRKENIGEVVVHAEENDNIIEFNANPTL